MPKHEIRKVRLEAIWRTLKVTSKQYITPQMLRVNFFSNELDTFESPSHDDHVKLLLQSGSSPTESVMRDFTPRAWSSAAGTFVLEFALHPAGPAADWAQSANSGDTLQIGGPRGSMSVPDDFDWYLLVGDATALPAIARRVESLRAGVPVTVIVLIPGEAEVQPFNTACECKVTWLVSDGDAERDLSLVRSSLAQYVFARSPASEKRLNALPVSIASRGLSLAHSCSAVAEPDVALLADDICKFHEPAVFFGDDESLCTAGCFACSHSRSSR